RHTTPSRRARASTTPPAICQRVLPVELVEGARDDVLRRLVERLRNRVVALVRPVGGEDLVGPASQKHVELTGDSLANGLVQGVVPEGHDPASLGEPVPRILLGPPGDCMTPSSVTWAMAMSLLIVFRSTF